MAKVLISKAVAEGIRDGRITAQYRAWDAPRVKVGGTQLTPAGVIAFTDVSVVADLASVSDDDARVAGMADAAALRKALTAPRRPSPRGGKGGDTVYRVGVAWVGEDPRVALREQLPSADELSQIAAKLARLDARPTGPWTRDILVWIRDHPEVVSTELAALRGVPVPPMKVDTRKLKALGLTISHPVGYELSPRGRAYLDWLDTR
ncbi:hypothetical protein MBRU_01560 [Mycolicibacterium brumae DSM 44177]|nr:hypothetical protein MBRU_01560 [Mycolicibacterium brumae DSM 44177]